MTSLRSCTEKVEAGIQSQNCLSPETILLTTDLLMNSDSQRSVSYESIIVHAGPSLSSREVVMG